MNTTTTIRTISTKELIDTRNTITETFVVVSATGGTAFSVFNTKLQGFVSPAFKDEGPAVEVAERLVAEAGKLAEAMEVDAETARIVQTVETLVSKNDPKLAGMVAGQRVSFGPWFRTETGTVVRTFVLAAVHTRFDAVSWFVWDHSRGGEVVRQEPSALEALEGLPLS